jgi:hypothetical protein
VTWGWQSNMCWNSGPSGKRKQPCPLKTFQI